jgi:DNA-binding transcriptional MerR regulator
MGRHLTLESVEAAGFRGVESDMRGIGETARASGLSVSALRFYDGAGVLVPASVDPATGYRRYADEQIRSARLIAGLRRVGMPLAEIARAVQDPDSVRRLLDQHLRRLEHGLADARREISRIHSLLRLEEPLMTLVTLPAAALAASLDAVRFAAGSDPELPMLGGVLCETDGDALTLVATDRYRLALARTAADVAGPPVRMLVPVPLVDAVRPLLTGDDAVTVTLDDDRITFETGGRRVEGSPLDDTFPDHRRLVSADGAEGARRVTVDVETLRDAVAAAAPVWREHGGAPYQISILKVGPTGLLGVAAEGEWAADEAAHVAVNREFLLEALDAGGAGQLVLELDGPINPLAVRPPGDAQRFSILMPVRR